MQKATIAIPLNNGNDAGADCMNEMKTVRQYEQPELKELRKKQIRNGDLEDLRSMIVDVADERLT